MSPRIYHIAAGILRQGTNLLLVYQRGQHDAAGSWALPGGVVEAGESLLEALSREIAEETGLQIAAVQQLAYVTQLDDPTTMSQSIAFIFDVAQWSGSLQTSDPDGVVHAAAFLPRSDALLYLQMLPWRVMREPLLAYLRGEIAAGSVWLYRQHAAETQLLTTIAPAKM